MKILFFRCFLIVSSFFALEAQEMNIDLESVPALRSKSYESHPFERIVIFSAPRVGSSLIFNIFRFLFEEERNLLHHHFEFKISDYKVLKAHDFRVLNKIKLHTLLVIPVRNPIDAVLSKIRVSSEKIDNLSEFVRKGMQQQLKYLKLAKHRQENSLPVMLLKYEEFENNLDYLLNKIESFFNFKINKEDRLIINSCYQKNQIAEATTNLGDFQQFLPVSGFHGKHIKKANFKHEIEEIEVCNKIYADMKNEFSLFGY